MSSRGWLKAWGYVLFHTSPAINLEQKEIFGIEVPVFRDRDVEARLCQSSLVWLFDVWHSYVELVTVVKIGYCV